MQRRVEGDRRQPSGQRVGVIDLAASAGRRCAARERQAARLQPIALRGGRRGDRPARPQQTQHGRMPTQPRRERALHSHQIGRERLPPPQHAVRAEFGGDVTQQDAAAVRPNK